MKQILSLIFILSASLVCAQAPELVIQIGHSQSINAVAFTPDSRYIATASDDRTVKMWHVATGLEMRTFSGHRGAVKSVCFSPDGKYMVSASEDKTVRLWDPTSGELIKVLKEHEEPVHALDFSADGKYLLSGGEDKSAFLWSTDTWEVKEQLGKFRKPIMSVKFSPNSQKAVISTFNPSNKILDFGRNAVFTIPDGKQVADFPSKAASMEFSPDGEFLLSGVGPASSLGLAKVDELPEKYKVIDFKTKYSYVKKSVLIVNYNKDAFEEYYAKNLQNGYYAPMGFGYASFIDQNHVVAGNAAGEIMTFKIEDLPRMASMISDSDNMLDAIKESYKVGFAQMKAYKKEDWEKMRQEVEKTTTLAEPEKYIPVHSNALLHLVLSPNKKYVFTVARDGTMKVTDLEAQRVFKTFSSQVSPVDFATISSDSKYAMFGKNRTQRFVMDLSSGDYLYSFETRKRSPVSRFALSTDQRYALLCTENSGYVQLWDLDQNTIVWETLGHGEAVDYVGFNSNTTYGISRDVTGLEKHWNLSTGEEIKSMEGQAGSIALPEVRTRGNKAIITYDSGDKKEIEHANRINNAQVSADGKFIISASDDGTFRLWNADTAEELLAVMLTNDLASIMLTPDRYYMATKDGLKAVAFQYQGEMFPFQQFDVYYNRPDIVLSRLGIADKELVKAYAAAHQKRLKRAGLSSSEFSGMVNAPTVKILNKDLPLSTKERELTLEVKAEDQQFPLKKWEVLINDVPIYGRSGKAISSGKEALANLPVTLSKGENEVQVRVVNNQGITSVSETFRVTMQAEDITPNLYVIAIGVSKYQDASQNLSYAAKDAQDFTEVMNKNQQYGQVFHRTLLNEQVTKEAVMELKNFLKQATVDDQVVVFMAGHGLLNASFDYIFGTHDIDFLNPNAKGLSYTDIESLLEGTKARRKVLFMDTCHSGELDKEDVEERAEERTMVEEVEFRAVGKGVSYKKDGEGIGLENVNKLVNSMFADVRSGTGATVIAAAAGVEVAREGMGRKNGLFTYCMITGLSEEYADQDADNTIMLSELRSYVRKQVVRLSKGLQMPTARSENIHDFRFW